MTPAKMLALYRSECERFAVASGLDDHDVYRYVTPIPGSNKKVKVLFTSKYRDDCRDWIARKAMAAVKRAMS